MGLKSKYTDETLRWQKFYHLIFISIIKRNPHEIICKWKCDCGKETLGNLYAVRAGRKKTCGCYLTMKKENNPRWSGVGEMSGDYWNTLIFGAKHRKIELNLTKEYLWKLFLKQSRRCALTGDLLTFNSGHATCDGSASIDRIDSSKGYIKGNVQWVHKDLNYMKQDFSMKYFLELCQKVCNHNATKTI